MFTAENGNLRFCGKFWATEENIKTDSRVMRYLCLRGKQTEANLANRIKYTREQLSESLDRLVEMNQVEFGGQFGTRPREVQLTPTGDYFALEMITGRRIAGIQEPEY